MREMTREERYVLLTLKEEARGRANAIGSRHLAGRLAQLNVKEKAKLQRTWERHVRRLVNRLIFEFGEPIIGDHKVGYFVAESAEEVERETESLRRHALHELMKAARLKKIPLPDMIRQMELELRETA